MIADTRNDIKEFRELICGALKHLSADLYSSPTHFLSEVIQNMEDASYPPATTPFLKLIIEQDYLLFCSNESGFSFNDVYAICSLSESTKQKGEHIGHKGLGFKSVFLCTSNPVIVSKPHWAFQFSKESSDSGSGHKTEMAYITPELVDYEHNPRLSALASEIQSNEACRTFLYLPLKPIYRYSETSRKYYESILASINYNVLLFARKLKMIVLDDRISGTVKQIQMADDSTINVSASDNDAKQTIAYR
jgi:sacsin